MPGGAADGRQRALGLTIFKIMEKKHGLRLSTEATAYLAEAFADVARQDMLESIDFLAQHYVQQHGDSRSGRRAVDRDSLHDLFVKTCGSVELGVAGGMASAGTLNTLDGMGMDDIGADAIGLGTGAAQELGHYLQVVDAFDVPQFRFHADRSAFLRVEQSSRPVASADAHTALFRDRFDLLKQRLLRNEAFRAPAFATQESSHFEITPIIHLKGKRPGRYLLFGMLTSIQDGNYHLEDPDAFIQLEFNMPLQQGHGLFTRNSFVLVRGSYTERGTFVVDVIGQPLPEHRQESMTAFGNNVDFFGGARFTDETAVLQRVESGAEDVSIVILSDVWLDQTRVLDKLRVLFDGMTQTTARLAFVLCGNFSSAPYIYGGAESKRYKEGFENLADLVAEFPQLAQHSHFIFVPGPHDPWAPSILPRAPIPEALVGKVKQRIRNAHFSTAPCRIKYCTQEIIVFRDDIANAMRRHSIIPTADESGLSFEDQLVRTLLNQSHLAPLPIEIKPRYWEFDHALRLYPQPHLLILADKHDPFQTEHEGCVCANPGSFPNTGYQFLVYSPAARQCQPSRVP